MIHCLHPSLLLLILTTLPFAAGDAVSCPAYTSRSGTTAGPLALASSSLTLTNTPSTGTLCTLFTTQDSLDGGKTFYIPVGRSYDGNNWERVAGKYSTLEYACNGSGSCTVTLPDVDAQSYFLTSYAYTLTAAQTSARFFERASFGATPSMLTLATTTADMATWIKDQLDESVTPITSHREYFRKRLNPRMVEMGKAGRAGPKVCDVNSRWRSFAFTRKDAVISSGAYERDWPIAPHHATLETKTVSSATKYIWRFGGHIRTMLDSRPLLLFSNGTETPIEDGTYVVCAADEVPGSVHNTEDERKLYAKFKIMLNDACIDVKGGNPDVVIDEDFLADEITPGGHVVDFSSVSGAELPSIGYEFADTVKLLTKTNYYDENTEACDSFPDPEKADYRTTGWIYSPYYEGRKHPNWDNATAVFLDEPVYAKMPDNSYYINDRRFTPLENTPRNPISDGGGSMTLKSVYRDINHFNPDDTELLPVDVDENPRTKSLLSGNEQAIYCSNGPPNVFNEEFCTLSTDPNACVRMGADDEDTIVVVKLIPLALGKINGHAGTTMFQIQGLDFTADTDLPCADGATSRWVKQDGVTTKTDCDALSASEVDANTYSAFTDLLHYSVTDNDMLRDVTMYQKFPGSGCDPLDANKKEFSIFESTSSTCFLNVHPEDLNIYFVRDETASVHGANGVIAWIDSGLTMDYWDSVINNSSMYDYFGRTGDILALEPMMERLGVYRGQGGKDVSRAPTSSPSESPSYGPSLSLSPVVSPSEIPSELLSSSPSESASPSLSPTKSQSPSSSSEPSLSPSTVYPSSTPSKSQHPSLDPSSIPSTSKMPSSAPIEPQYPSDVPSASPSLSDVPSSSPSRSAEPSSEPANRPSSVPSVSAAPSSIPSSSSMPSQEPTQLSQIARTFNDNVFHDIANDPDIAYVILETQFSQKTGGVLVCGSTGEIAPDPQEDDYFDYWTRRIDSSGNEGEQKKTVWTKIALEGSDQLVQRIAFALSQIFAISPSFLGYSRLSEAYTFYYDIFVRHGSKTYRDVLKNVAYSVKMGMQLSHAGSKSLRFDYDGSNRVRFPDENYAREVMQLETIGLDMLNMDGTLIKDNRGNTISTYDMEDIITFSRAWTGFDMAIRRGNYEELDYKTINWMDPMTLDGRGRDWFPKRDLLDGWIGDRYPLCSDLPTKSFLKTGATFKLLGRSSQPRYHFDDPAWDGDETIKRMTLHPNSALYRLLCAESNSACTFPSAVTLTKDVSCFGFECDLDTVRVVQVTPDVFYEYVRRPCVHLAFLDDAKTVYAGTEPLNMARMCASPTQPVATTTCCTSGSDPELSCLYTGDFVTYDTNRLRCGAGNICHAAIDYISDCGTCCEQTQKYEKNHPEYNFFQWTEGGCSYQVKINLDSTVAIVHAPEYNTKVVQYVSNSVKNMNYFHVPWPTDPFLGDKLYPNINNQCGNGTCISQPDWTCLCDVTVFNSMAFTSEPANAEAIRSTLKIGAFEPEYFGSGYYATGIVHSIDSSISIFHLSSINDYSEDTIFMLLDEFGGETIYLKNLVSTISIGDDVNDYFVEPLRKPLVMRNPLSFFDLVKPETRDALYETEAVIDHYMHHPNAAPFISMQLIQHIGGISNPSPSYVNRVSEAFTSGTFVSSGITFGTGKLSDLKAVVAAILLDQEATANTLDADPTYGGIKEPIIKVLQFLRAMEYKKTAWDRNIYPKLSGMCAKVGQMAHESPDQFSFFLPDYSPPGQMAQASLFSPAAQVLTLSTTISTVEGFFSLARQGLSPFGGGFGAYIAGWGWSSLSTGDYSHSVGYLNFSPSGSTSNEQVKEIADLLTSGRLSSDVLTEIVAAVDAQLTPDTKIRLAQQIIATTPEFHTTNLANRNGNKRSPTPVQEASPNDGYKAIVVLHLSGGLDSFNVLMPHSTCPLYSSYRKTREVLALKDEDMDHITNSNPELPCQTFGVHKKIPILKEIYDDGKGIFMANIGHLAKPVTKNNWYTETKTHLFSHKTMEREAQLVDAFQEDGWSTGVVGRMLDKLQSRGMSVSANGIDGKGPMIEGNPGTGRTVDVIPSSGVNTLTRQSLTSQHNDIAGIENLTSYLNQETDIASGIFSNYWAQNLIDSLNKTDYLSDLLSQTSLVNHGLFEGQVGSKLDVVSRMILKHSERSVNRDAFYLQMGGYDGHSLSNDNLDSNLPVVNQGLSAFYKEMVDQNMINNVTFVLISEFGRTTTPNSGRGSDHAWGGNAFVFGGEISGSKILGKYPKSFANTDPTNVGRGRLIPAVSWESMWYGISNWFGITDSKEIAYVLPNNGNMGCQLYSDKDMYVNGNTTVPGCNDRMVGMKLSMFIKEPRYLTGMEQKTICKAAIAKVSARANVTSRCIVVDQKVIVSIDATRRRLLLDFDDTRHLEGVNATNATFTVEAEVALDYDDTSNKTGAEYIENVDLFTADMNQELTGNCTGTCEFQIDNVAEVLKFEALVTEAPSSSPSFSAAPSSHPSNQPSNGPSSSPSVSTQPSESPSVSSKPSSVPSESPSESTQPSYTPSVSSAPSDQPSGSPFRSPSSHPSVSPSFWPSSDPSLKPSTSQIPSSTPSDFPSESPSKAASGSPSFIPSNSTSPSGSPSSSSSDQPSDHPSYSFLPTQSEPSSKPSGPPSSYPSRECSIKPENCGNGGMWSPHRCECMCIVPYCPNDADLQCTKTTCPLDYHENLFRDCTHDCPWFKHTDSCATGEQVPTGTSSIYISKDTCCEEEFPSDIIGCKLRSGDLLQLRYNAQFLITGIDCSSSSEDKAVAAVDIAKSTIAAICKKAPALNCGIGDKVIVTKICGQTVHYENVYSSFSGIRLLTHLGDDVVEYTIILTALTTSDLRQKDALLSQYLQGSSLDIILTNILNQITSNSSAQSIQSISAIYYEFIDSFIEGLGLYYPAWGNIETCVNDGNQPDYMNYHPELWMTSSLEDCCKRHYSWDKIGCMRTSEPDFVDPTANLYYPDWGLTNTCANDGNAPPYMKMQSRIWMHSSLMDCCKAYYSWEDDYIACMSSGGESIPTQSPVEGWYVEWETFTCVKNCEGLSPCGGLSKSWNILQDTKQICCQEHLWWLGGSCQ